MEWIQSIRQSLEFIEKNLKNKLNVEDVAQDAFTSNAHFQRLFYLVTGYTIGQYIRYRRLSLAGRDFCNSDCKVIDLALQYQYDTPESFSKAFYRFHGIHPSDAKAHSDQLKYFYPLTFQISIQGGFDMSQYQMDEFYWYNTEKQNGDNISDKEKYQAIANWALKARGQNPDVFDELTEWISDDSEWGKDQLAENEQILMQGIIARFRQQNEKLRAYLMELVPSGVVNEVVFKKLDYFDRLLTGTCENKQIQDAVASLFTDFSVMQDHSIRELIAGNKTGPTGTDSVKLFGYINCLKEADAQVQWTLFMPDDVARKQDGFRVENFVYKTLPAMRFLGFEGEEYADVNLRLSKMKQLDALSEYKSGFDYDLLLMHFYGVGVDVGQWHGVFGRFMKADTPVPEGFLAIDFAPNFTGVAGPPYMSKFAFATFTGNTDDMHKEEGFDGDAMYDITRNIILGQGGEVPYPIKYWTAEVFFDGCDKQSTGYLFSANQ